MCRAQERGGIIETTEIDQLLNSPNFEGAVLVKEICGNIKFLTKELLKLSDRVKDLEAHVAELRGGLKS